jgi:hypothetical protein
MLVDRGGCGSECWQLVMGWREGGCERRGSSGSCWWRLCVGVRVVGRVVWGECPEKVGDSLDTFFWTDLCLEEVPLCARFRHLFALVANQ